MPRGLLARSRLLTGCACAVFAILTMGAGCSTTTPAVTVSGKTLTLYISAPSSLSGNPQAQDVADTAQLAFDQFKGQVKGFTLNLHVLHQKVSDNARTAINDKTSVGYVGEVVAGASVGSLGITNAEDLLQVSPTEAASVSTNDFESFSTYGRTFASFAPNQPLEAMLAGPAGKVFVQDFHSAYQRAPSSQAILGYAGMTSVLEALEKSGSGANNRATVRDAFFGLSGVLLTVGPGGPVLGKYTVNKDGTVTITSASS